MWNFNPPEGILLVIQARMTIIILFKCIIADDLGRNYIILNEYSAEENGYDGD